MRLGFGCTARDWESMETNIHTFPYCAVVFFFFFGRGGGAGGLRDFWKAAELQGFGLGLQVLNAMNVNPMPPGAFLLCP